MKSIIYTKAAELIAFTDEPYWLCEESNRHKWKYACHAIENASDFNTDYYQLFEDYFCPENKREPDLNPWWDRNGQKINKQNQLARQLALLFMAEIVRKQ